MSSSTMASMASPRQAMPGAYSFGNTQRRLPSLSIQTSTRPLSAFSTDTAYYSPEEATSPANAPFSALDTNDESLQAELAALESLRRDVRRNLTLRPLGRLSVAPSPDSPALFHYSTAPSSPSSVSSPSAYATPATTIRTGFDNLSHQTPSIPSREIQPLSPTHLAELLVPHHPLPLIFDTRSPHAFSLTHIANSVNLAIPSLILKRCRKPGALSSIDSLRTFIANDSCTSHWEIMMSTSGRWSGKQFGSSHDTHNCTLTAIIGDVVVLDDDMDESDFLAPSTFAVNSPTRPNNLTSNSTTAWTLLPALTPLTHGRVLYLRGGFSAARNTPELQPHIVDHSNNLSTPRISPVDAPSDSDLWPLRPSLPGASMSTSSTPSLPLQYHSRQDPATKKGGLFILTSTAPPSPSSSHPRTPIIESSSLLHNQHPSTIRLPSSHGLHLPHHASAYDSTPSPSPSITSHHGVFGRPPRKPMLGINTTSTERLRVNCNTGGGAGVPRLHLHTSQPKAPMSAIDVGGGSGRFPVPRSPLRLDADHLTPNLSSTTSSDSPTPMSGNGSGCLTANRSGCSTGRLPTTPTGRRFRSRSRSPQPRSHSNVSTPRSRSRSPFPPSSPITIRPTLSPTPPYSSSPNTINSMSAGGESGGGEGSGPTPFIISTILPNFLYLGPEITTPEHAEQLASLGVKRILNMAAECEDELGLGSGSVIGDANRYGFERYLKIPMRDTVEEENVSKCVRDVCQFLDDARLHSSPTFVHCKAGKSRSVTAVMAYLIHANHWPLSRAYAFVVERRKGISPNIGFVSELMNFEEEELGGKSIGVASSLASGTGASSSGNAGAEGSDELEATGGHYGGGPPSRRAAHGRESLPPAFHQSISLSSDNGPPAGVAGAAGDSGQEMEIKDSEGRYRHARRAPVDELTLQPLRRVSKAGLESSSWT